MENVLCFALIMHSFKLHYAVIFGNKCWKKISEKITAYYQTAPSFTKFVQHVSNCKLPQCFIITLSLYVLSKTMWPYNNSHNHDHTIKSYNLTYLNRTYTSTTPNLREYTIETHFHLMFDYEVCFETRLKKIEWLWWNGIGFKRRFKQLSCAESACFIMLHELQLLCAECACESLCWPSIHTCMHIYKHLLKFAIDMSCKFSKVLKPLLGFGGLLRPLWLSRTELKLCSVHQDHHQQTEKPQTRTPFFKKSQWRPCYFL